MSVMSQYYSVIIYWGISAHGHGKEVVDVINTIDKRYINRLMSNVQLPVSKTFDSKIIMHYFTQKVMSVWIKNPKNIHLRRVLNMESSIRENIEKKPVKENGQTENIMFRIMLMLHTKMWKWIVIQTNYQHYHFVVHIQSLVEQGGWVSITIYVFIQN